MNAIVTFFSQPVLVIAWVLVLVAGTGRFVRLVVFDDFPPTAWWRNVWNRITDDGPWAKVFNCGWCFGPYATAGALGWFFIGLVWAPWLLIAWWVVFGFAGLAYAVSILVRRDEPDN